MRLIVVLFVGLLLIAAGITLFARGDAPPPAKVVFRLGEGATPPPQSAEKVKLGTSTRTAVASSPGTTLAVELPAGAAELLFSTGVAAADGGAAPVAVRFHIRGAEPGGAALFSHQVPQGAEGWHDHRLRLEPGGSRRLRLETAVGPGGAGGDLRAYWGSVRALGPADRRPPNVILISLDTLGADHLGSFGGHAGASRHIDELLARSASFRRAYAQYPNTLVSHASMLTGRYPRRHGMLRQGKQRYVQLDNLASVLAGQGYLTAAFTEDAFVGSEFGFDHGFDAYDDGRKSIAGDAAETFGQAAAWLEEYGHRAPFFLFVHTYEVHIPYMPRDAEAWRTVAAIDPGYEGRFLHGYGGLVEEGPHNLGTERLPESDVRHLAALYAGEIDYLDRVLHRFLGRISSLAVSSRTLVVVTADHGEEFDEHGKLGHGETLYNSVLHVPLAFYWPGQVRPGARDAVVELVDVMPTVLDLVGVVVPPEVDGVSLTAAITTAAAVPPRPAFAELASAEGECGRLRLEKDCALGRYAVRTERFKLISSERPPFEHLFDLARDPGETRDVAAEHPVELAGHRRLLHDYLAGESAVPAPQAPREIDAETRERLRALGYE